MIFQILVTPTQMRNALKYRHLCRRHALCGKPMAAANCQTRGQIIALLMIMHPRRVDKSLALLGSKGGVVEELRIALMIGCHRRLEGDASPQPVWAPERVALHFHNRGGGLRIRIMPRHEEREKETTHTNTHTTNNHPHADNKCTAHNTAQLNTTQPTCDRRGRTNNTGPRKD